MSQEKDASGKLTALKKSYDEEVAALEYCQRNRPQKGEYVKSLAVDAGVSENDVNILLQSAPAAPATPGP